MSIAIERKSIDSPIYFYQNTRKPRSHGGTSSESPPSASLLSRLSETPRAERRRVDVDDREYSGYTDEEEINNRTNEPICGKKRARSTSSSDESPERGVSSRSVSPEISYGGSPVAYKLCPLGEEYLVVKVPMSDSRIGGRRRDDRLGSRDDPDSDDECKDLFDATKTCAGSAPARPLGDASPSVRTPRRSSTGRFVKSTRVSPDGGRSRSPLDRRVALRMKLRRSTERSNYKVQEIREEPKLGASAKSASPEKRRFSCPKDELDGTASTSPKLAGTRSDELETPETIIRDTTGTPRSTRPRRTTGRIDYSELASVGRTPDKENKSDNAVSAASGAPSRVRVESKTSVESPRRAVRAPSESAAVTPKRRTPCKSTTKLEEAAGTPKRTPCKTRTRIVEEAFTPNSSRKRISKVETPSMSRRTAGIAKPTTTLEEARTNLHVSAIPKSLPCREAEFNDIYQFLERKLIDENSGCIYISGVPGTGKTATVNEVVRCLKKLVEKGKLDDFEYVEINGMKLTEPRQAYVQIHKRIYGTSATWEQAYENLDKRFARSTLKTRMTLLLVDELDLLCNKRQDVVYNLLDWPAKPNARLIVVTIANTMDLPERALMGRVTSRLGLTRLTFQPYTHKQLQEIVLARLKHSDAFRNEAIELVARKVAAVSGDARRALDICRRATEIAERNDATCVTMGHVNEALGEMIASSKVRAIQHSSAMEKLFLQAVCAVIERTGLEETLFQDVYRQLAAVCSFEGFTVPVVSEALAISARLGANRLLLCEHSRLDVFQRILLNVSHDDVHFATQNRSNSV